MHEKISVKINSPRCEKFWAKKIVPRAKNFESKQSHLAQKILSKQNLEKNWEFGGVAISFLRFSPQFKNLNYSAARPKLIDNCPFDKAFLVFTGRGIIRHTKKYCFLEKIPKYFYFFKFVPEILFFFSNLFFYCRS